MRTLVMNIMNFTNHDKFSSHSNYILIDLLRKGQLITSINDRQMTMVLQL